MQSSMTSYQAGRASKVGLFDRRSPVIDIVFTATLFLALALNLIIGPLTPLTIIGIIPVYMLLRWERLPGIFASSWPLFLLPLLAIVSAFWSEAPERSVRYGILYLITVTPAIFIGAGVERDSLLKGIFIAFAIYIVLSLLFGRWVGWGVGGRAFAGLMGSKNAAGDIAALTLITSTMMIFYAWGRRQWVWFAIALLIIPIGLYSLWASKATGALVATIIALPCLLAGCFCRRLSPAVRNMIFILIFLFTVTALVTLPIWIDTIFESVLDATGKDAGITGRDILWKKADELIIDKPWVGQGYSSFWVRNNLEAEYLWRAMGVQSRTGFNFHNTPREILVHLGFLGLTLYFFIALFAAIRLIVKTVKSLEYASIFCFSLFIFELPRLMFEVIGFTNMHFATVIVFIVMAYGLGPKKLRKIG